MRICVVPGSFDPITLGHADVIGRALGQYDRVIVAVLVNSQKKTFFSMEERKRMIEACFSGEERLSVESFDGLLVDFAKARGACSVVRGLRAVMDFEYEFQLASLNRMLAPEVETVFFMTRTEYMFISSSMVREIGLHGGDIRPMLPEAILPSVEEAFAKHRAKA